MVCLFLNFSKASVNFEVTGALHCFYEALFPHLDRVEVDHFHHNEVGNFGPIDTSTIVICTIATLSLWTMGPWYQWTTNEGFHGNGA
jgi:hypothetical protein